MASKYYAVKKGKVPGIYLSWNDCKAMVDGYQGAVYKSFKTIEEAEKFITGEKIISGLKASGKNTSESGETCSTYAFVDGSFNKATHTYGYGGFLVTDNEKYVLQGADNDAEMATMRNVAGEIKGAEAAVKKAIELGIKELVIYYDYMGIEMWATGAWKRNKAGTIAYHDYIMSVREQIKLTFVKVKGHSGVEGNEEADKLAKQAVGIL
nr:ribonuclease H family protein [uncultured Agathobacter sp.]